MIHKNTLLFLFLLIQSFLFSQINVGKGSYTTTFPGTDAAGRNGFPSGAPQLSGNALGKPVPTNDWWSKLIKENHADNLFNYPMTLKTTNTGLIVTYIPWGVIGDSAPIEVGLTGLNTNKTTVSDYSDWTVTMNWQDADNNLETTAGIGLPFLYFEKDANDIVEIKINAGNVTINNEILIVENASSDADFVFYAPTGSTWLQNGNLYTSNLNGKEYWSMAMLPLDNNNVNTTAQAYKKYAYVFPKNTTTSWLYNENNSIVTTTFTVETSVKEGTETNVLLGLLPHQWSNLATTSLKPEEAIYKTLRGDLKTLNGNSFVVENTFKGILPTLPYLANYSNGFSPSELESKIAQIENDGLATWTDSYNEGQVMNRLIQTARIADQTGNFVARDKMIATVKERLEDWLTYQTGEKAFLFYYNSTWSTMLGYPSGHGQDTNINDHHFHWGYFIHAAAFMEQFEPGWSNNWAEMIDILVRDAASPNRDDTQYPFLRNFSPYAGHSWANGFATFPQGNDQESTSESMQFASSLIHWGTITENKTIRDLGIYIYTTEQTAVEEYWFDVHKRNFRPEQQFSLVSRVWGNSYDNGTFWTADIAASYGIEMYPIHGGSLYLGHNQNYAKELWNEISVNTGILSNEENPNLWHDTYWKYLSLIDSQAAIDLYNSNPNRNLKFGISDAQTYHWLHSINALGIVDATITANYPIATVFTKDSEKIYVAHNYSNTAITVTFSDGYNLNVPANKMATSLDVNSTGTLSSDFKQAFPNGSINLSATVSGTGITKVAFFDGETFLGEDTTAPYSIKAENLSLGIHGMYAKIYEGDKFNVTNIVSIQVGEQVPFSGTPFAIPGTIESGEYDKFEGGLGQNIAYVDTSVGNNGNFRTSENVDVASINGEGETVGWISSGEWLEYSVNVATAGLYNLNFRYASGNDNGGGPFFFEVEGKKISTDFKVSSTGGWDSWSSKTVSDIALTKGENVLRLFFSDGEFNLGKMTFTYKEPFDFTLPTANAGENVTVISPATNANLDGSLSKHPENKNITYLWEQIYGPTTVIFNGFTETSPIISNLEEGVYKFKLTVNDGNYTDFDEVLVIVSKTGNTNPTVAITSPSNNSTFEENKTIKITATASDLDGNITLVEFYDGTTKIGEDATEPYRLDWENASIGSHAITAVATDNKNAKTTSEVIILDVEEVVSCSESSNAAQQGAFSKGYKANFETVGNTVTISFELLDTDKQGVIAFLWQQTPFAETQMENTTGLKFTKKINGFTKGETITYACKFAFAGGLSVTKYISYVVGENCGENSGDTEAPTNFTATLGNVTSNSVELLVQANDNSGTVVYEANYNANKTSITGNSGTQKSLIIANLTAETTYNFQIDAADLTGNKAVNNSIEIEVTTKADLSTECAGNSSDAQQGAFSLGYTYDFKTDGTAVTFTFELLDTDKTDVIAFLWKQSPFNEVQMDKISGNKFSKTVSGFTDGQTISYACKLAFAGGLAVTKYFTYTVGENCTLKTVNEIFDSSIQLFPNPTKDKISISSKTSTIQKVEIYSTLGKRVYETTNSFIDISLKDISNGIYIVKIYGENVISLKKIMKR
ncbi:glycosyl hydrolase [uncultured Polaribacter sp.]|uniref:glycosyl hydrolase n=1 Tax=uncultured Polaribacter sp. TaxID=174711 RepID=UPI002622287A|nr:glycosyl hydrolase [uncultured Polaribacter sp.]